MTILRRYKQLSGAICLANDINIGPGSQQVLDNHTAALLRC